MAKYSFFFSFSNIRAGIAALKIVSLLKTLLQIPTSNLYQLKWRLLRDIEILKFFKYDLLRPWSSPWRHPPWWNTNIINCGSQTLVRFYLYEFLHFDIFWHKSITRTPVHHSLEYCVCIQVLFIKKNQCRRLGCFSPILTMIPPFSRFSPTVLPLSLWLCERLE